MQKAAAVAISGFQGGNTLESRIVAGAVVRLAGRSAEVEEVIEHLEQACWRRIGAPEAQWAAELNIGCALHLVGDGGHARKRAVPLSPANRMSVFSRKCRRPSSAISLPTSLSMYSTLSR